LNGIVLGNEINSSHTGNEIIKTTNNIISSLKDEEVKVEDESGSYNS